MKHSFKINMLAFSVASVVAVAGSTALAAPPPGKGNRPPVETTNNLSFPAIAADGFSITELQTTSFLVEYTGDYPGLTEDEILWLEDNGPWYAQKTAGNAWQAGFALNTVGTDVPVTCVDWGDNIESNNPKLRRPFRLEVVLFKDMGATTLKRYTMEELEYPSSANELQGTNTNSFDFQWATVVSSLPDLVVQYLGTTAPTTAPTWDANISQWKGYPVVPVTFAVELNVGGKYIFGASEGGWKPDALGWYRITFYAPQTSDVRLDQGAVVGNFLETGVIPTCTEAVSTEAEGGAGKPVIDPLNNLSYVDVQVVGGGGGGGGKKKTR
jgi:hypothetical protein